MFVDALLLAGCCNTFSTVCPKLVLYSCDPGMVGQARHQNLFPTVSHPCPVTLMINLGPEMRPQLGRLQRTTLDGTLRCSSLENF
jgi:hypothetical protein